MWNRSVEPIGLHKHALGREAEKEVRKSTREIVGVHIEQLELRAERAFRKRASQCIASQRTINRETVNEYASARPCMASECECVCSAYMRIMF